VDSQPAAVVAEALPFVILTPTQDYRRTSHFVPKRPHKGLDAAVNRLIGAYCRRDKVREELRLQAEQVDAQAAQWKDLTNHHLQERLLEFREGFRRGGKAADEVLLPALAAIREAADRQLGLRPYVVQLMGALALQRGCLAEMATGEGKTLTAGLAAVLSGWTRRPCHIITVNDYLVTRDAEWLTRLYHFCGVGVGTVTAPMNQAERQKGYGRDVTYVTSKELLADFLRDRIRLTGLIHPTRRLIRRMLAPQAFANDGLVLRGLHTAIVDEADSVLIDEAVTPLIISAPHKNEMLRDVAMMAQDIVGPLEADRDYRVDLRYREVELSDEGLKKVESRCTSLPGLWNGRERRTELIKQALVAREFFLRGKQYIIDNGKVVIVDEFTGRPMPQRTWRQGMHQAIEAKEGLAVSDPSETIARLSFQRFFRFFHRLAGMTGTAREASAEFWQIYQLPVITIPTNEPCIREKWPDRIFSDEESKWDAVADEVQRIHKTGRPILVGTRSVAASERLAAMLTLRGLDFKLLNASQQAEEASIIAMAGEAGRITIATNMAGRGTDIKLGHGVVEMGGLHVLGTERHESGRVDRQLCGRAARQGDPGSAQMFVSVEDELIRRYLYRPLQSHVQNLVRRKGPAWEPVAKGAFELAQGHAQRVAFRQRQSVLRMDDWMEDALSFAGTDMF
jgi:preprotein translocase subunit SecA